MGGACCELMAEVPDISGPGPRCSGEGSPLAVCLQCVCGTQGCIIVINLSLIASYPGEEPGCKANKSCMQFPFPSHTSAADKIPPIPENDILCHKLL